MDGFILEEDEGWMDGGRQREVARLCISMDDFSGSYWLFFGGRLLGPWD